MSKNVVFWLLLLASVGEVQTAKAQDRDAAVEMPPLKVGTYECPPFVIREADDRWSGLGILLWEEVAKQLGRPYELQELPLADLLDAAEDERIDVGVSCISITPDRETRVDFSHSLHEAHLAIAVRDETSWAAVVHVLTDAKTLYWLGVLALVASCVGGVYYALEHRINPKIYSRPTALGRVLEAFLLGLLSITRGPVNYYEFKTLPGRVLTVALAVATTLFLASFTAVLASAFTLDRLKANITGPADLSGLRVGSKEGATSQRYLDRAGIAYQTYPGVPQMLTALDRGRLDAVVADDPVLRYEIKRGMEAGRYIALRVLPYRFERQNYGLVLREDPEFHETINRALLLVRSSDLWAERLGRYLGTVN
jgi:polar amino acid transport system substrate-binding protein